MLVFMQSNSAETNVNPSKTQLEHDLIDAKQETRANLLNLHFPVEIMAVEGPAALSLVGSATKCRCWRVALQASPCIPSTDEHAQ